MKIYLIIIALFSLSTALMGQKIKIENVPSNVKTEFQKKFPKAEKAEWEMEKSDYEVNFKIDGKEWSANFNPQGKLLETEQDIKVSELPQAVKQSIEKEIAGGKIEEASIVTVDGKTMYEVEVKKDKSTYEIKVSSSGEILKKEEKKKHCEKKD